MELLRGVSGANNFLCWRSFHIHLRGFFTSITDRVAVSRRALRVAKQVLESAGATSAARRAAHKIMSQRKSPTPRGAQELRGIHGAVTGAICLSLVRPFCDRLRAARWRAVIQCAISRAPSRQDIGSTVSLYRSEFLDCLRGAVTNSYPN